MVYRVFPNTPAPTSPFQTQLSLTCHTSLPTHFLPHGFFKYPKTHSLHKAFTALYIWNTFNPGSPVAHFLTSLLSAVSQWYGTYLAHITHSIFVLKEWVSPSPLSFTTPWCRTAQGRITQTGRHVWTRTHCLPLGDQAPNLPRHLSRAQSASLAQSAALPSPTLPPPPSVAYREKQTNKQTNITEFLWGIPINY